MQKSKIDAVVLRETVFVAAWVLIFSAVMEAVFLAIGRWDYTVLLGNILGSLGAVMYFFLMGLTVQKAIERDKNDPTAVVLQASVSNEDSSEAEASDGLHKDARQLMAMSQTLRMLMLVVIAIVGAVFDCFNLIAVLIPYFFPRIAVMLRPLFFGKQGDPDKGGENN